MAGWALAVAVRRELGPSAMILEREMLRVESISSRIGWTVRGKAASQSLVMPTLCTPWPGKKRAVRGRLGLGGVVVVALWRVCVLVVLLVLLVYIVGRRAEGRDIRLEGWCIDVDDVRRRAERDIAPG